MPHTILSVNVVHSDINKMVGGNLGILRTKKTQKTVKPASGHVIPCKIQSVLNQAHTWFTEFCYEKCVPACLPACLPTCLSIYVPMYVCPYAPT